jgi:hypothetical protein
MNLFHKRSLASIVKIFFRWVFHQLSGDKNNKTEPDIENKRLNKY